MKPLAQLEKGDPKPGILKAMGTSYIWGAGSEHVETTVLHSTSHDTTTN